MKMETASAMFPFAFASLTGVFVADAAYFSDEITATGMLKRREIGATFVAIVTMGQMFQ